MGLGMAEADEHGARASGLQQLLAGLVQDHEGLAAFFAPDFHVLPAEFGADAGAEGFGNSLLGRKARGQEWGGGFVRKTIADFIGVQDALEESLAESLVGSVNAGDFDDGNANAQN